MGNEISSRPSDDEYSDDDTATDNGKRHHKSSRRKKKNKEDDAASFLIDSVCSSLGFFSEKDKKRGVSNSFDTYSDNEEDEEDDESLRSLEDRKKFRRRGRSRNRKRDDDSTLNGDDDDTTLEHKEDDRGSITSSNINSDVPSSLMKPLASSFAKKCHFTKTGIGKKTQHYEGLTLNGNVVLMSAAAMQLKGCPTICDEDLRRVEQTYPNQFSRLPDELLLSSGWRRISKFCHFSNKPIPDGIPFFHSKERLHHQGGYYFLLASAVGMVRPIDVEPINRDTLVVLETDFAVQCDAAPPQLINDPDQWTLVDKFCFFSGGPINTEEDVYYVADFDGDPIYMLAFLSPSLTPEELYRLGADGQIESEHGFQSVAAVDEVESVYDLTERDFDDLKLYHLGPCRALPPYILTPQAWTKVLPPHFMKARQIALDAALDYERRNPTTANISHEMQYTDMTNPNMSQQMNEINAGEYDPYNQHQQWQQMPNPDQSYPHDPSFGNNAGYLHSDMDIQMQQHQLHDGMPGSLEGANMEGNYYMEQRYGGQEGMRNNGHQINSMQQFQPQQSHAQNDGAPSSYYDPEAGFEERTDHHLPGGYELPTPHDQRNRETLVASDEASRIAREVQEEGAFGIGTDEAQPMDEALATKAEQIQQHTSSPITTPQKAPPKNETVHSQSNLSVNSPLPEKSHKESTPKLSPKKRIPIEDSENEKEASYYDVDEPSQITPNNAPTSTSHYGSQTSKDRYEFCDESENEEEKDRGTDSKQSNYNSVEKDKDSSSSRLSELSKRETETERSYSRDSPRKVGSPVKTSSDRRYSNRKANKFFNDERSDSDHMDDYDDYQENYPIPTSPPSRRSKNLNQLYEKDYTYPQDEYDSPQKSRTPNRLYSPHAEIEPSVDEMSSVGNYESSAPQSYRIHTQVSQTYPSTRDTLSPKSRTSPVHSGISDYTTSQASHASYAMRGAQEILKKNRKKRYERSKKAAAALASRSRESDNYATAALTPRSRESDNYIATAPVIREAKSSFSKSTPENDGSWESSSEVSGSYVSGSSSWTDSSITDRTTRRALILQMAKARMKGSKTSTVSSTPRAGVESMKSESFSPIREDITHNEHDDKEEDLDFTGELD